MVDQHSPQIIIPRAQATAETDKWQHIVYTYSDNTLEFYVDTKLLFTHVFAENIDIPPDTTAYVGAITGQWSRGQVSIGPWSIYEKILTSDEIISLYQAPRDYSFDLFGHELFQYNVPLKELQTHKPYAPFRETDVPETEVPETEVTQQASTTTTSYRQTSEQIVLHVFAISYNILRIMSGMGGLAYSN
jgi:hypothetical protein